jgi:hypothetical protein
MHKFLGSIPSTAKRKKRKGRKKEGEAMELQDRAFQ